MASFKISPTSGALPETRITSPIMLHLLVINDRSEHSRKYALPVETVLWGKSLGSRNVLLFFFFK
ncbi:hypothetical protein PUN28_003568 [Cardiocondyla obscurior]|uniref:Uncharacterized protein n=1 Tax=Cardiocondyla obscurior TaxID=286306 RepID=A0AAW2GLL8_9HYME